MPDLGQDHLANKLPDYTSKRKSKKDRSNIKPNSVIDKHVGSVALVGSSVTSTNKQPENTQATKNNQDTTQKISAPTDSSSKSASDTSSDQSKKEKSLSQGKNWFFDVYASPDIPFSQITTGNEYLLQLRKQIEKMQLSYTIGIKLGRSFGKHFSGKIGFQYSQINAKFSDSMARDMHNRYRSVDFPALIGYTIGMNHFNATINAGIIYNIYSWYQGTILDTAGPVDIHDGNVYKQHTGFSLYFGLSFMKQLDNRWQLFAEPYFRYRLSSMANEDRSFTQKINIAGLSLGLRYNFPKSRQQKSAK
jgi:hypothetical protein